MEEFPPYSGPACPAEDVESYVGFADPNRQQRLDDELRKRVASHVPPNRQLDVFAYARYRREQADWLTMEVGPGMWPSGILRRGFTGKSAYIGIENYSYGLYSDKTNETFADIREKMPEHNIFLRSDPTFGRNEEGSLDYYDFPDATADEIYLSQVYDKPNSDDCEDHGDQQAMTDEVARLLKPGGKALIFDYERNLEDIVGWLANAGLELRFVFRTFVTDIETDRAVNRYGEQSLLQKELDCIKGDLIIIAEKPEDWTRASASRIRAPFYPAPSPPPPPA